MPVELVTLTTSAVFIKLYPQVSEQVSGVSDDISAGAYGNLIGSLIRAGRRTSLTRHALDTYRKSVRRIPRLARALLSHRGPGQSSVHD